MIFSFVHSLSSQHHEVICGMALEMVRHLADDVILPLDIESYANHLEEDFKDFKRELGPKLNKEGVLFGTF